MTGQNYKLNGVSVTEQNLSALETFNETSFPPLARPADEIMSLAEENLGCNLLMAREAIDQIAVCPLGNNARTCGCWVFAFLSCCSLDREIFLRTTQPSTNRTPQRYVAQVGAGPGVTGTERSQSSMIRTEAVPGSFLAPHAPPLV